MEIDEVLNLLVEIADTYIIDKPYIVGGLPRDIYLKKEEIKTTDIDITTNSSEVMRLGILLAEEANVVFELNDDGHVTVFTEKFDVDFSSHFVSEAVVEYLDGKHKGFEEAFSRDFTINTLHQDLETREIIDPTGMGFEDIKNKKIRTPVPPEITFNDDPRRIYRAINLAARYGYEIDDEIINFVNNNNKMFGPENIKDKYISQKISKALLENEEFTLKALRDLDLFKYVPLVGKFKEVLIERKMLADYLESAAFDKFASIENAKNWKEYSEQGASYKDLEKWWKNNYSKMPGKYSPDYYSWTSWYMDKFNNDWGRVHRSPEETISIMKEEVSNPSGLKEKRRRRKEKIDSIFKPVDDRVPERARDYDFAEEGRVFVKPGVNIENVTNAVKSFIYEVGKISEEIGAQIPIITSGWRSLRSQAALMAKNWENNGGLDSGRRYLQKIYGKNYGGKMATVFETYGTGPKAIEEGVKVIKEQPVGSYHISDPGMALDFALTDGIREVLNKVEDSGMFDIKIVDETDTAGPHYHVTIKGERSRIASRKDRVQILLKLSNTIEN